VRGSRARARLRGGLRLRATPLERSRIGTQASAAKCACDRVLTQDAKPARCPPAPLTSRAPDPPPRHGTSQSSFVGAVAAHTGARRPSSRRSASSPLEISSALALLSVHEARNGDVPAARARRSALLAMGESTASECPSAFPDAARGGTPATLGAARRDGRAREWEPVAPVQRLREGGARGPGHVPSAHWTAPLRNAQCARKSLAD
jgi:hypothetical protein